FNNSVLTPIDIAIYDSDSKKQRNEKKRLTKELDWCQRNEELITRKANRLYDLRINHSQENIALTKRCCDFEKLESVLEKYISSSPEYKV
ncbi:MAG: type III toxin-antitoxin system ToxN/AbiQ family toxin, partial [Oscillospiraceae bacterium]|nr:type III toxin-antitoxin system ToxN/AbiQ family toxin [Oscillospiraceae bacterium]